jgi:BRO family, N-terminal domain.
MKGIKNMKLKVIKRDDFNNTLLDIYRNSESVDFYMTRKQIGEALGYSNPQNAIDKIHERNKERLDKYSVTAKLTATDKKQYDTHLYTFKGILEVCRWSNQPKANEFFDYIYDLLESLYKGELTLIQNKQRYEQLQLPEFPQRVLIQLIELMGDTGQVQISGKELGKMLGVHDSVASVTVKKLQQLGYIEITRLMYDNGCNQPNTYSLTDKARTLLS